MIHIGDLSFSGSAEATLSAGIGGEGTAEAQSGGGGFPESPTTQLAPSGPMFSNISRVSTQRVSGRLVDIVGATKPTGYLTNISRADFGGGAPAPVPTQLAATVRRALAAPAQGGGVPTWAYAVGGIAAAAAAIWLLRRKR